jgi:RNA polymerase sigma-70 factor (ECF subfamily)
LKNYGTDGVFGASFRLRRWQQHEEQTLEKSADSLVVRLKNGDEEAACTLVDKYHRRIYAFLRHLGHSWWVSEELTQRTFVQAWQNIKSLKNDQALNTWLYRIARNLSKEYWRKNKKRIVLHAGEALLTVHSQDSQRGSFIAEEFDKVREAVVRLPIKLKEAVILHYMQDFSIAEAAAIAGIREGTFKSRLSRALKKLRKELARRENNYEE